MSYLLQSIADQSYIILMSCIENEKMTSVRFFDCSSTVNSCTMRLKNSYFTHVTISVPIIYTDVILKVRHNIVTSITYTNVMHINVAYLYLRKDPYDDGPKIRAAASGKRRIRVYKSLSFVYTRAPTICVPHIKQFVRVLFDATGLTWRTSFK